MFGYKAFPLNLSHMDFNTELFRNPTKRWPTHQLNPIYTEVLLEFIYIYIYASISASFKNCFFEHDNKIRPWFCGDTKSFRLIHVNSALDKVFERSEFFRRFKLKFSGPSRLRNLQPDWSCLFAS